MTDTTVRARIDAEIKERAKAALDEMGLSVADAIRLMMAKIAEDRRLPFETTEGRDNPPTRDIDQITMARRVMSIRRSALRELAK